jgi:hypothetical protein
MRLYVGGEVDTSVSKEPATSIFRPANVPQERRHLFIIRNCVTGQRSVLPTLIFTYTEISNLTNSNVTNFVKRDLYLP